MTTPIVMIVGPAGSGKDTVAGMLAEHGGVCIAQADPMKRFAREVFKFTDDQLWGPSENRNAPDPRGTSSDTWEMVYPYFLGGLGGHDQSEYTQLWLNAIGLGRCMPQLLAWFDDHVTTQPTLTPRHVLQTLGTEFGRKLRDDVWVTYAQNTAQRLLEGNLDYDRTVGPISRTSGRTEFVVITDGRFKNEVLATKRAGGMVLKVTGPEATALQGAAGKHQSEQEQNSIPDFWFDGIIWNDKARGLDNLRSTVNLIAESVIKLPPLAFTGFDRISE